eukprot:4800875-Karenia_brevis.AAC.1
MMKRLEDVATKIQAQSLSGAQGSQASSSLDQQPAAGSLSESSFESMLKKSSLFQDMQSKMDGVKNQ